MHSLERLSRGLRDAEHGRLPPRRGYDPVGALVGKDAAAFRLIGMGVSHAGVARQLGIGPAALERVLLRLREHFGVVGNAELAGLAARHRAEADGR